ncbi:hypothetical protein NYS50_09575 [Curtobacterium flaccumfaciens pv. flaccumfaciens]|uniref:hypothetical protein n=1 Tax=Curtobacterium flaccumfaciens TaxID=2035 RepID=UPI00217D3BBD|nr:hypothetical protein [Curtobacterium flaccumfaciens]MCS6548127.1 hypothetical protein [Curtobacterium flaccumfaciens pv. flaccumfaciens]
MNTEPPQGDDLQRMLVSMKQNVLERATPLQKRRRGRSGIVIGVVALLAVGTATGAVALTLSQQNADPVAAPTQTQQPEPAPSATTPSSAPITGAPVPKPTPTSTPTPAAATIPTDCRALVPAEDYDRFFGDTPYIRVEPPEEGLPPEYTRAPGSESEIGPETAPTKLYCLWKDPRADISGLAITAGTGTPAQLQHAEDDFYQGWTPTCVDADGIRTCRQTKKDPQYGTDWARTMYVRGDTWLQIDQSNVPTDGLLDAVVGEIWGD